VDRVAGNHIAIPATWAVIGREHHPASYDDVRISDHDAYVLEVRPMAVASSVRVLSTGR
jgi:hypothetical protein